MLSSIFPLFEATFKPLLFEKNTGWAEDRRETSTPEYLSLQFGGWEVIKYINHVNNEHLRNVSYFPHPAYCKTSEPPQDFSHLFPVVLRVHVGFSATYWVPPSLRHGANKQKYFVLQHHCP